MKKRFFLVFTGLFLVGCQKELNKEELINEISEQNEEIESYHTFWEAEINVKNRTTNEEDHSTAMMDLEVVESENAYKGIVEETSQENETASEYYVTEEGIYENDNDTGWYNVESAEFDVSEDLSIAHNKIVKLINELEDELELEKEDGNYFLVFDGVSEKVYNAMKEPYSLDVTGFHEDDIEHHLKIEINEDDFNIEHLENLTQAENEYSKISIGVEHDFSDINQIDSIEVPEEVKQTP